MVPPAFLVLYGAWYHPPFSPLTRLSVLAIPRRRGCSKTRREYPAQAEVRRLAWAGPAEPRAGVLCRPVSQLSACMSTSWKERGRRLGSSTQETREIYSSVELRRVPYHDE